MFPNDDLKKDVQSYKFVSPSDTAARIRGFVNLEDMQSYCRSFNVKIDDFQIPIHYDNLELEDESHLECYEEADQVIDVLTPIVTFNQDAIPVITSVLQFLADEFSLEYNEIKEILEESQI